MKFILRVLSTDTLEPVLQQMDRQHTHFQASREMDAPCQRARQPSAHSRSPQASSVRSTYMNLFHNSHVAVRTTCASQTRRT